MARCNNCRGYYYFFETIYGKCCPICGISIDDAGYTIVPDEEEGKDNGDTV